MRWTLIFVLMYGLVGCQGSSANYNPFSAQGPSLVPPPPTGSAGRTDPYYQNSLAQGAQTRFTSDQNSVADQRAAPGYNAGASVAPAANPVIAPPPATGAPGYPPNGYAPPPQAVAPAGYAAPPQTGSYAYPPAGSNPPAGNNFQYQPPAGWGNTGAPPQNALAPTNPAGWTSPIR